MMTAPTGPGCSWTGAYETLRTWATSRPRPARSPPGAGVLLQRGVAAWLRVGAHPLPAPAGPRHALDSGGTSRASPRLQLVLASMIEQVQWEKEP